MNSRIEKIVVSVIVVFSIFVLAAYVAVFHREPISGDPALWGQLGDYLGGALNPFFGLLTTIFAFFAYKTTKEQLALSAKSASEAAEAANKQLDFVRKESSKDNLVKNLETFTTLCNFKFEQDTSSLTRKAYFFENIKTELVDFSDRFSITKANATISTDEHLLQSNKKMGQLENDFIDRLLMLKPYLKIITECCRMSGNADEEQQLNRLIFLHTGDCFKEIVTYATHSDIFETVSTTESNSETIALFKSVHQRISA